VVAWARGALHAGPERVRGGAPPAGDTRRRAAAAGRRHGLGQKEDKRLAREAGFDHHLRKPVDPDGLGRLLAGLGDGATGAA
jgi:hypothetical protein